MNNDVSLKEFISVQFDALRTEFRTANQVVLDKIDSNEEQHKIRRRETTEELSVLREKQEDDKKEMGELLEAWRKNQERINTRILIWISLLSVVVVLALLGLASEAGSLLGILINAF